ncbi:substrate-binding domain-containing protein [Rhodobacterales bacterium HKCCE2091]|nr:substrate-binding domain-containing protein [Rhodobacterales bacterium HKCCE2091]
MVQKAATIQDVARAAQVSTATVSRALSNPGLVSARARAAVEEAIRATGYRVNQAARNLRMQRAGAVLVLVPNLGNPFFSRILAGLSAGFAGSDYVVLITDTADRPEDETVIAGQFRDGRIDGVVTLDGTIPAAALDACAAAGMDGRILFACEWVDGSTLPSIRSDNPKGARLAVRHLHDLGHRRIAHVTGPEGNVLTAARREGMLAERERLDLPARPEWIIRGDFSLASGHEAAARIAGMMERPTAVFCASDMVAFGLISGLTERGIDVPGDISVIGFDDIDMSEYYVPALTTIRQDRREIGLRAARRMLGLLEHPGEIGDDPGVDMIDVELVARASTAPPKG